MTAKKLELLLTACLPISPDRCVDIKNTTLQLPPSTPLNALQGYAFCPLPHYVGESTNPSDTRHRFPFERSVSIAVPNSTTDEPKSIKS
jgi:hypothetical protein